MPRSGLNANPPTTVSPQVPGAKKGSAASAAQREPGPEKDRIDRGATKNAPGARALYRKTHCIERRAVVHPTPQTAASFWGTDPLP